MSNGKLVSKGAWRLIRIARRAKKFVVVVQTRGGRTQEDVIAILRVVANYVGLKVAY